MQMFSSYGESKPGRYAIALCVSISLLAIILYWPLPASFRHAVTDRNDIVGSELYSVAVMTRPVYWTIVKNDGADDITIVPSTKAHGGGVYFSKKILLRVPEIRANWNKDGMGVKIRFVLNPYIGADLHSYLDGKGDINSLGWQNLVEVKMAKQ